MLLIHLPPETLYQIACSCPGRQDVVSLALSCKYLYEIASRGPLQYFDIRSRLQSPALWSRLSDPDNLKAHLVHSLTILHDFYGDDVNAYLVNEDVPVQERVPEQYRREPDTWLVKYSSIEELRKDERALISALKRMVNLRRFRWFRYYSPESKGEWDLWRTINELGNVDEIDIVDLLPAPWPGVTSFELPFIVESPSFWSLRGVTSFTFRADGPERDGSSVDLTPMYQMLVDCPHLKNLSMDVGVLLVQSADMLLQHGTWPNLSSIRMFGFTCYLAIITQFLNRHPALEQAKLPHPQVVLPLEDCMLSDGALPNLSSLEYQAGTAAAILQNPTAAQNLRNIAGINLRDMCRLEKRNGDPWDRVLALWRAHLTEGIKMRPSISSLKLLSYQPSYLLKLAGLAPQLTELDLDLFEDDFDPAPDEHCNALAHFPALTTFSWNYSLYQRGPRDPPNDVGDASVVCRLARACPNLTYIRCCGISVIIIMRGESGIRWVCRGLYESMQPVFGADEKVYHAENPLTNYITECSPSEGDT